MNAQVIPLRNARGEAAASRREYNEASALATYVHDVQHILTDTCALTLQEAAMATCASMLSVVLIHKDDEAPEEAAEFVLHVFLEANRRMAAR